MAFPQIGATVQSVSSALATSHTVALPSGITAGMLLIVDINWGVDAGSPGWPIGWTQFYDRARSSYRKAGAWRIADGTEGASITVTSNGINTRGIYVAARITDFDPATAPVATIADANTANPDCPNSAPGWGILDILWLAIYGWNDTTATNSSYPTDYTLHQSAGLQTGTGGCGRAFAARQLNASSENPGAATISNGEDWVAVTVAIKPVTDTAIAPSAVAIPIVIPAPQISTEQFLSPDPVAIPLILPAPNVVAFRLFPDAASVPLITVAPTIAHSLALAPTPVIIPQVIPAPNLIRDQAISPSVLSVPLQIPTPFVGEQTLISPSPIAVPVTSPNPLLTLVGQITPSPVQIELEIPSPLLTRFLDHVPAESFATIYAPDGTEVGTVTALKYKISRYENRVGRWSCEIPVDELIGILPSARVITANWRISIQENGLNPLHSPAEGFLLYKGVVETREFRITAGGLSTLAMTGSFRTIALTRRVVGKGYTYALNLGDFVDELVGSLLGANGDAIYSAQAANVALYDGLALDFMTHYAALLRGVTTSRYALRESWDHDRLELTRYDAPPNTGVVLRKLYEEEDRYLHENGSTYVGLIAGEPVVRYDGSDLANRIIPYGTDTIQDPANFAGHITANLTLEHTSLSSPYVVQSDLNPDGSQRFYLEDAVSVAANEVIEHNLIRPDIKNPTNSVQTQEQAANVLYWTTVNELIKRRSEKVVVSLPPLANGAHIWSLPGDQVWVQYEGETERDAGSAVWIDLEKRFRVIERHDESHPSGVRRVHFVVAAPDMEYELGDLPDEVNPFDDTSIPPIGLPPMPAMPSLPGLPELPELPEIPELPPVEELPGGGEEGAGIGELPEGILKLTGDDVIEYWDGSAWQNAEDRLSTTDPGGGALWKEPP